MGLSDVWMDGFCLAVLLTTAPTLKPLKITEVNEDMAPAAEDVQEVASTEFRSTLDLKGGVKPSEEIPAITEEALAPVDATLVVEAPELAQVTPAEEALVLAEVAPAEIKPIAVSFEGGLATTEVPIKKSLALDFNILKPVESALEAPVEPVTPTAVEVVEETCNLVVKEAEVKEEMAPAVEDVQEVTPREIPPPVDLKGGIKPAEEIPTPTEEVPVPVEATLVVEAPVSAEVTLAEEAPALAEVAPAEIEPIAVIVKEVLAKTEVPVEKILALDFNIPEPVESALKAPPEPVTTTAVEVVKETSNLVVEEAEVKEYLAPAVQENVQEVAPTEFLAPVNLKGGMKQAEEIPACTEEDPAPVEVTLVVEAPQLAEVNPAEEAPVLAEVTSVKIEPIVISVESTLEPPVEPVTTQAVEVVEETSNFVVKEASDVETLAEDPKRDYIVVVLEGAPKAEKRPRVLGVGPMTGRIILAPDDDDNSTPEVSY